MYRRFLIAGLFLALGILPSLAQAPAKERLDVILAKGVLRVGTTMDTPPFSMRKPDGSLAGFDIEVLEKFGAAMGVKIDYVKMSFGTMLADLKADKFDIAMSGMGRTVDRALVGTFSKPYARYGKLMMIRAADRAKFKSLADLDKPGNRIAYNRGGLNDKFAHAEFKHATLIGFDSNAQATSDLLAGKVTAEVSDSTAAIYEAKWNPKLAAMEPAHLFNPVFVAILLHRDDQSLLNVIDIWLDQSELDGTLPGLRKKWLEP